VEDSDIRSLFSERLQQLGAPSACVVKNDVLRPVRVGDSGKFLRDSGDGVVGDRQQNHTGPANGTSAGISFDQGYLGVRGGIGYRFF